MTPSLPWHVVSGRIAYGLVDAQQGHQPQTHRHVGVVAPAHGQRRRLIQAVGSTWHIK